MRGGEAVGDTLGDTERGGVGTRGGIGETAWCCAEGTQKRGLLDQPLLGRGPEKACRLNFFGSELGGMLCGE